ncbi:hypothetical protein DI392_13660 [Vibrio albus]|uniref:Uncharacterized protein n=6 Tax=Vibrionaceae TaxID=641 RepID=A0A0C5H2I9_VIBPH|nr:hypothetical protein pVPH1_0196 [Vibrio parahaemolyticus]PWI32860.1 hypothetical protein DI392_13660 [Vibrio albus]
MDFEQMDFGSLIYEGTKFMCVNVSVLCLIALNGQFYSVSFDMYLLSFWGHYDFALKYAQVLDQSFD